jgi:hypothetical protein
VHRHSHLYAIALNALRSRVNRGELGLGKLVIRSFEPRQASGGKSESAQHSNTATPSTAGDCIRLLPIADLVGSQNPCRASDLGFYHQHSCSFASSTYS